MVVKVQGQILGVASGDDIAPFSQITILVNAINVQGPQQIVTLTESPTIIAALAPGQNVALYLATTPADQATIEGATPVTSIDSVT